MSTYPANIYYWPNIGHRSAMLVQCWQISQRFANNANILPTNYNFVRNWIFCSV